jgi:hypothetical protein
MKNVIHSDQSGVATPPSRSSRDDRSVAVIHATKTDRLQSGDTDSEGCFFSSALNYSGRFSGSALSQP